MRSQYLTNKLELGKKLVNDLLKKYEFVSLLGKHTTGKTYFVSNFVTNIRDTFDAQCGFVVKIYNQNIYSEYSFTDFSEDNYNNIINNIDNELRLSNKILSKKMELSLLKDEPLVKDFDRPREGKNYSNKEIIDELTSIRDEIMKKDKRVIQGFGYADIYDVSSFYISKNRLLTQSFSWCTVGCFAVTRNGDVIKQARKVFPTNNMEENFKEAKNSIDETVQLAIDLLDAQPVEPGVYDIVTDPSITGLIAHEAFGHGVEMDMFVKNRAKSRLYINKPVASNLVSMRDGAASIYSCASYFFDDDGVLAHDTLIIDKGILKTGISDSIAANELGTECTGNSRRESPSRKAYSRMTNTFFEKGESKVEDIIKSIKHGYLLCETNNGMEDPKNWNIQCTAEYGREIVDGKFTGKIISPVVMSGYVPDLLMSISMVSDKVVVIGSGHCGKGHKEWVPVSDGGPYLKARCKLS